MIKIKLFVGDIELGYLTEIDKGYVFSANKTKIAKAKKEYPIQMRRFELNERDMGLYKNIPSIFDEFVSCQNRADIIEKAGLEPTDSEFEKLYKIAGLDFFTNAFNIKQG